MNHVSSSRRNVALAIFAAMTIGLIATAVGSRHAAADTVYIYNPLYASGTVTNDWNHPSFTPSPYAERALDLTEGYGNTEDKYVWLRMQNVDLSQYVYYDTYNYGTNCTGKKYKVYKHPPGGDPSTYVFIGAVNYVHIDGYTYGESYNIVTGDVDGRLMGAIAATQCGSTGPHLHHGHDTSGGDTFNDATWITTSTGIATDDITLYK